MRRYLRQSGVFTLLYALPGFLKWSNLVSQNAPQTHYLPVFNPFSHGYSCKIDRSDIFALVYSEWNTAALRYWVQSDWSTEVQLGNIAPTSSFCQHCRLSCFTGSLKILQAKQNNENVRILFFLNRVNQYASDEQDSSDASGVNY